MSKDTEFKIFAQVLFEAIGDGMKPEQFVQELFSHIYADSQDNDKIENGNEKNYRNYFYGQSNITYFVKKITGSLDKEMFSEYIANKNVTDDTIEYLCSAFLKTIPDINCDNYSEKIAERFESIIRNAAATKSRKKSSDSTEEKPSSDKPINITETYGSGLVAEAGNICPYDGCSRPLVVKVGSLLVPDYTVVIIDTSQSADNVDNMIALCHSCALKYQNSASDADVHRLKKIKEKISDESEIQKIVSDQHIEESIRKVILHIPDIKLISGTAELNYEPVPLVNKIDRNKNHSLFRKVKYQVEDYYQAVESTFKELARKVEFKKFCNQISINYDAMYDSGYNPDEIFEKLVDWLQNSTSGSRDACEIVVSFFIQKCEVFDDIT